MFILLLFLFLFFMLINLKQPEQGSGAGRLHGRCTQETVLRERGQRHLERKPIVGLRSQGPSWANMGSIPLAPSAKETSASSTIAWVCEAGVCLLWLPTRLGSACPCELRAPMASGKASGLKAETYLACAGGGGCWSSTMWAAARAGTVHCNRGWNQKLGMCSHPRGSLTYSLENVYSTRNNLQHMPSILLCSWKQMENRINTIPCLLKHSF